MTNSDTTFGTHNKITHIYTQVDDGSTSLINFTNTEAAKSHYYTDDALAVFDECCTELQWVVIDDTILKYTMAFGVVTDPATAGWGDQFNTKKNALDAAGNWVKTNHNPSYTIEISSDHLF